MNVLVLLVAFALGGGQDSAHRQFEMRLEAGADCPELFRLRNDARRSATPAQAADMNEKLRSIACYSSTSKRRDPEAAPAGAQTYTLREYRIYRQVIDTPMSVPEAEAVRRVARESGTTPGEVKKITAKVQGILAKNRWFGSREAEERRASDWKRQ